MPTKDSLPTNINDTGRQKFVYPGELPQTDKMTAHRLYTSASAPDSENDGADTAGLGQVFAVGDIWNDTTCCAMYFCSDNTTGAAVWKNISPGGEVLSTVSSGTATISAAASFYSVTYTPTGTVAITLPAASASVGMTYTVADAGANAGTNNITVTRAGSDTIIGDTLAETSAVIASDGDVLRFIAINSTTWKVW